MNHNISIRKGNNSALGGLKEADSSNMFTAPDSNNRINPNSRSK